MESKSVREIEEELVAEKDWRYMGETRASTRAPNSLLNAEVEFETALFNVPLTAKENGSITKHVIQRFREKTFDNFEFREEKVAEDVYDTSLVESNKEIVEMYEELERTLKRMTDYNNDAF